MTDPTEIGSVRPGESDRTAGRPPQGLGGLLRDRLARQTGRPVELVETHISWVLLTGDIAYKIKKPVDLGFVDFSTLELRRHFCAEELRLNRRLAPDAVSRRRRHPRHARRADARRRRPGAGLRGADARVSAGRPAAAGAGTGSADGRARGRPRRRGRRVSPAHRRGAGRRPVRRAGGRPALRGAELHPGAAAGRLSRRRAGAVAARSVDRGGLCGAAAGAGRTTARRIRPRVPRRPAPRQHRAGRTTG